MNDAGFKRVKHHHFPGDHWKGLKILRREVTPFTGARKRDVVERESSVVQTKSRARHTQRERTRAVLKDRWMKECAR